MDDTQPLTPEQAAETLATLLTNLHNVLNAGLKTLEDAPAEILDPRLVKVRSKLTAAKQILQEA